VQLSLAVLNDDRFAIMRDSEVLSVHESDDASLGCAVRQYIALVNRSGATHVPIAIGESSWHPHAG
jgi:hypothetical protein